MSKRKTCEVEVKNEEHATPTKKLCFGDELPPPIWTEDTKAMHEEYSSALVDLQALFPDNTHGDQAVINVPGDEWAYLCILVPPDKQSTVDYWTTFFSARPADAPRLPCLRCLWGTSLLSVVKLALLHMRSFAGNNPQISLYKIRRNGAGNLCLMYMDASSGYYLLWLLRGYERLLTAEATEEYHRELADAQRLLEHGIRKKKQNLATVLASNASLMRAVSRGSEAWVKPEPREMYIPCSAVALLGKSHLSITQKQGETLLEVERLCAPHAGDVEQGPVDLSPTKHYCWDK